MRNKMRQGRRLVVVVVVQARFYRQSGPARVLWSLENINVGIGGPGYPIIGHALLSPSIPGGRK